MPAFLTRAPEKCSLRHKNIEKMFTRRYVFAVIGRAQARYPRERDSTALVQVAVLVVTCIMTVVIAFKSKKTRDNNRQLGWLFSRILRRLVLSLSAEGHSENLSAWSSTQVGRRLRGFLNLMCL